jgi:hypothetical protein
MMILALCSARGGALRCTRLARSHGNSYYALKKEISAQSGRFPPVSSISAVRDEGQGGVFEESGEGVGLTFESRQARNPAKELPAANFMTLVGFAHLTELIDVGPQRVAFRTGQMILVEHMLDGVDRVVLICFIEFAFVPLLGELTKLFPGFVEPLPVVAGYLPDFVAMVQIHLHLVD